MRRVRRLVLVRLPLTRYCMLLGDGMSREIRCALTLSRNILVSRVMRQTLVYQYAPTVLAENEM